MDHAGNELFAGAGFAFDEDGGFGGGDLGEGLIDFDHPGGGADHVGIGDVVDAGFFFVGFEEGGFGATDLFDHVVEVEGFSKIVECPAAGGGHDSFHGAAAGHENDGAVGVVFASGAEDIETGSFVDIDIGQHDGVIILGETNERFAGGADGVDGEPF